MDLDPAVKSRVWWKGAITSAIKGIPQGLMLGAIAAGVLIGGLYLLSAMGAAGIAGYVGTAFNYFLFNMQNAAVASQLATQTLPVVTSLAIFNPLPIIALNTILTSIGNFLSGGDSAVNAYKQQVDHDANVARLERLEGRELALEEAIATSPTIKKILAEGPRSKSYSAAEETRDVAPSNGPTIH